MDYFTLAVIRLDHLLNTFLFVAGSFVKERIPITQFFFGTFSNCTVTLFLLIAS